MGVHALNPSTHEEEGRWISIAYVRLSSAARMPQDSAGPVPPPQKKRRVHNYLRYNVGETGDGRGVVEKVP